MKLGSILIIATALSLAVCGGNSNMNHGPAATANNADAHAGHAGHDGATPKAKFAATLTTTPAAVSAGAETVLTFMVKDERGATVKDLPLAHEKPMHLLIVSSDLAEFEHIHPEPQADGSYQVKFAFPSDGTYQLYADYTPRDAAQVVDKFEVKVNGTTRAAVPLTEDKTLTKTVDGLAVTMTPDKPLRAGAEVMLNFQVNDAASGKPAADLQKYLGEMAHFVIISQDLKEFLHAHPMAGGAGHDEGMKHEGMKHDDGMKHGGVKHNAGPVPTVSAHTTFPTAGLYKVWAQFQRGGKVITVPFVVRVGAGETTQAANAGPVPTDALKITVSADGYTPASINVKAGQPLKLAFYRPDGDNCGGEVVFPKLKLRKKLPVGQTTLVEITPQETGELAFACGMGMMQGKIIVQ